jgi:hypothetical protein
MGSKVIRRHCFTHVDRKLISEENTFLWLRRENLKAETESEIIAARLGFTSEIHESKYLKI